MRSILALILLWSTIARADTPLDLGPPPAEIRQAHKEAVKGQLLLIFGGLHVIAGLALMSVDFYQFTVPCRGCTEGWPMFIAIGGPLFALGTSLTIPGIVHATRGYNRERAARKRWNDSRTLSMSLNGAQVRF